MTAVLERGLDAPGLGETKRTLLSRRPGQGFGFNNAKFRKIVDFNSGIGDRRPQKPIGHDFNFHPDGKERASDKGLETDLRGFELIKATAGFK